MSWIDPPLPSDIGEAFAKYWRAVTGNADGAFPSYNAIMRLCQGALPTHKMGELRNVLREQGLRDWHEYRRWDDAPHDAPVPPPPAPEPEPEPVPEPEPEPAPSEEEPT